MVKTTKSKAPPIDLTPYRTGPLLGHSQLDDAHFVAIGRVAHSWACLEYAFEELLTRLALAPSWPGRALTNRLQVDNRLEALRSLLSVHNLQFHHHFVPKELCDALASAAPKIAHLKNQRNKVVHWIWMRSNNDMYGTPFRVRIPSGPRRPGETDWLATTNEIIALADEITAMGEILFGIAKAIPEPNEASLRELRRPFARR